jgi:hypothetical protein
MATNEIRTNRDSLTAFAVTTLHSMPGGQIWQSGLIANPEPENDQVGISFSIPVSAGAVAEDRLNFYWANADGAAADEIFDAGLADAEQRITVANEISDVRDILDLIFDVRVDRGSQTLKGSFSVFSPGEAFQLLIELESAAGAIAALGSIVRYRFGTPQIQP